MAIMGGSSEFICHTRHFGLFTFFKLSMVSVVGLVFIRGCTVILIVLDELFIYLFRRKYMVTLFVIYILVC